LKKHGHDLRNFKNHRGNVEMEKINKKEALGKLRKAKGAHIKWRAYAQALVSGVPVSKDKIPVEHTACSFGRWYHGEGKQQLGHLATYDSIYTPHEMLHEIYKQIFNTLTTTESRGLKNLLSSKTARENRRMELARSYMEELVGVSEALLKALDILEEEVREMSDE
jgi:hypothetical protein